jgi:hypothetical protein
VHRHDAEAGVYPHFEKKASSVKSAYRFRVQIQEKEKQASTISEPDGERGLIWKLIWNANVPPKIKVFGWKLATNTLGLQAHRNKRNMDVIPTCSICGIYGTCNFSPCHGYLH